MQLLPIDLTSLVAVILGISIVLVPVIGLTARYALSPTVQALAKLFESKGTEEAVRILERRMELQEQEIAVLTHTLRSLTEGREFERQLAAPPKGSALSDPGAPGSTSA
jgi:hypothetical protein